MVCKHVERNLVVFSMFSTVGSVLNVPRFCFRGHGIVSSSFLSVLMNRDMSAFLKLKHRRYGSEIGTSPWDNVQCNTSWLDP